MTAKGYVSVGYCLLLQLYKLRGDEWMRFGNRLSSQDFRVVTGEGTDKPAIYICGDGWTKNGKQQYEKLGVRMFSKGQLIWKLSVHYVLHHSFLLVILLDTQFGR